MVIKRLKIVKYERPYSFIIPRGPVPDEFSALLTLHFPMSLSSVRTVCMFEDAKDEIGRKQVITFWHTNEMDTT